MLYAVAALIFGIIKFAPTRDDSLLAILERTSFDLQMSVLRELYPRAAPVEPVLIGIDESAFATFDEPQALWHAHYAKVFDAMAIAKPAVFGLDVVLPERSFDHIRPGSDIKVLTSIKRLTDAAPVVFAHTVDRNGKTSAMHPTFLRVIGEERDDRFGIDQIENDRDTVARQFSERKIGAPSLAGQMARVMQKPVGEGYIDFSVGPPFTYIPIQRVLGWLADDNSAALKSAFGGKVVLLGSVLQGVDRWNLPVNIAAWEKVQSEPSENQPGAVVHLQVLRNLLGGGLLTPLPAALGAMLVFALLAIVFVPASHRLVLLVLAGAPVCLFLLSMALIVMHFYMPAMTFLVALWIAVGARATADGMRSATEKNHLRDKLEGSVSPALLEDILAGKVASGISADTAQVCVMFTDIRGFTALSESLSPEAITTLLTRYFDRMVDAVHRHDGTMDKFIGDGMMVLFGAPRPLPDPCGAAVKCAHAMTVALEELNREFAAEGLAPIAIGIGINYGKVVVGNIGSTVRNDYSAIGDVVNVASRLEGLTKRLKTPIVMTESVKVMLGKEFDLIAFGEQALRGHSSMHIWGVNAVPK